MKYKLIFWCLIIISGHVAAQPSPNPDIFDSIKIPKPSSVTMGFYLGANNNYTLSNQKITGIDPFYTSFMFGAYGQFVLSPKINLEVGLGWMSNGAKFLKYGEGSEQSTDYITHTMIRAGFVTVPILAKYDLGSKSEFVGGIRASDMTLTDENFRKAFVSKTQGPVKISGSDENVFDLPHNWLDIGLVLGYEYHFNNRFSASVMYNFGLVPIIDQSTKNRWNGDIFQESYYDSKNEAGNYNRSLSIRLCYNFLIPGGKIKGNGVE